MKSSAPFRILPIFLLTLFLLTLFVPGTLSATEAEQRRSSAACATITGSALCSMIELGWLNDLHCPDFFDFRTDVRQFYLPYDYALAWTTDDQPTPQARALILLLQDAAKKGLRAEDYDGPFWNDRMARIMAPAPKPSADDLARFDLALTVSVIRYVSALHDGRVDPRRLKYGLDQDHRKFKVGEFVRTRLVQAQDVRAVVEGIEPQYEGYRRTLAALNRYQDLAREGEGDPLPAFKRTIKPGDAYAGVGALGKRLRRLGDLTETRADSNPTDFYEGALVEAIKHFQERHGLPANGAIDQKTFTQLTIPFSRRVTQLELALERWRWLPPELPQRYVVVNLPEFELRAYDNHHPALSMKVVVGKAFHQTPVFEDKIEYLIFRPYWNVPLSITRKELIPLIKKNPAYLEKHNFEVVSRRGEAVEADVTDGTLFTKLRSGEDEIRQRPGPGNSLGLIKFVFPNNYDVYLHGTPEQALFSRSSRAFSHGCIRIEDPAALAGWVLRDNPYWTNARIQETMNGTASLRVNLAQPIPVLLLYGTAVVNENGKIYFFEDFYGQDVKVERALAAGYPYPP